MSVTILTARSTSWAFVASTPLEEHMAFADALATAHTASQVYEEEIQYLAEDANE